MPFEPAEHDSQLWVPDDARARIEKERAAPANVLIDNQTDLTDEALHAYFVENTAMFGFGQETRYMSYASEGSMLARSKWQPPRNVIEEITLARDMAERDDDVRPAMSSMIAAAFHGGYQNQHEDEQIEHTFEEMSEDIGLLGILHEMYRELLISSQINTVTAFTRATYDLRPESVSRVIKRSVAAPMIGVLPAERIRVLGNDLFGRGQLAYLPEGNLATWLRELFGRNTTPARQREMRLQDPLAAALFIGRAQVNPYEVDSLNLGQELFLLNPDMVKRSTFPKGAWRYPRPLLTQDLALLEAKRLLNVMDHCVPLDTQILTRAGWKSHDEVAVGDETLGYNAETGRSEWTKITGVHHAEQVVQEIGHDFWSARCTPGHRWATEHRSWRRDGSRVAAMKATADLGSEDHLVLAAPAPSGPSPLTPEEAALIAWIACDGNLYTRPGARGGMLVTGHVYQAKAAGKARIEEALAGVPHGRHAKKQTGHGTLPMTTYTISAPYLRALWDRAGLAWDMGNLSEFVVGLSQEAREAFLDAAWQAEGWMNGETRVLSQKRGPVLDAIVLVAHLLGIRATVRKSTDPGVRIVSLNRRRTVKNVRVLKVGAVEPVWCVQTELGSWTMRQGECVALTGNSLLQGGINYIVVAKKGDKDQRATPPELENLQAVIQRASRAGVLVGDHRLSLDIIQPNLEQLLHPDKRRMLGRKLSQALLRVPEFGSDETGAAVQSFTELAQAVITDDRMLVVGHLHRHIWRECMQRNQSVFSRSDRPTIWMPKIILQGLDFWTQYLLKLYDRGDLPRKYMVEFGGYDYASVKAQKQREVENGHDEIFAPPPVPYSAPNQGNKPGSDPSNPYRYGNPNPGPNDNGSGRPTGSPNRNGAPADRTRPSRVVRRTPGEVVRASWDEEQEMVVRVGEITEHVLGEYPDAALGRVTPAERTALDAGQTTNVGNLVVIPVNTGYVIEDVKAVRLGEDFSMLTGNRKPDGAIVAAAFCFREPRFTVHEAEDMVLRWGFDIATVQADVPDDSDTLTCPSCGEATDNMEAADCPNCGYDGPPFSLPASQRRQPTQPLALHVTVNGSEVTMRDGPPAPEQPDPGKKGGE